MTFQELQKQALQLSTQERWQLVQTLLDSLRQDSHPIVKPRNLSRLRGIAKTPASTEELSPQEEYAKYLTQKYQ